MLDATRSEILAALDDQRSRLGPADNLLIYYAGHGYYDDEADRGYWLPVDARSDRRSEWISNADVTDALRAMRAKHVLVIADSCYSGTLTRGSKISTGTVNEEYFRRLSSSRARIALTSGGFEPVSDGGGDGHSVFTRSLLDALRQHGREKIDASSLFTAIRRPVALDSNQTPTFGDIRMAGHKAGDFVFVPISGAD